MTAHRARPAWATRRFLVAVAVALVALAALAIITIREGPDRTVVGTATTVEPHQLCVTPSGGPQVCAFVDAPQQVRDFSEGDCIRMRYSPDDILADAARAPGACT